MSSADIFYALGDLFTWTFGIFEVIGNMFNDMLLLLGFVGFGIWMHRQHKFNQAAANDPNQIK